MILHVTIALENARHIHSRLTEGENHVYCACRCPHCGASLTVAIVVAGRWLARADALDAVLRETDALCVTCGEIAGRAMIGDGR